jgi:nitrogen fixation/metabolism regulation signal transduction histidine kinase
MTLSVKGKIRLALFIVGFLSLATSFISLAYMNNMIRKIKDITQVDAALAALARDISIQILEARREEKNFIIYLDQSYIKNTYSIIDQVTLNVAEARVLAPQHSAALDSIDSLAVHYLAHIEQLATTFQEDPNTISRIQKQMLDYEERLKKALSGSETRDDSLPSWISDLNILLASTAAKMSVEKVRLLTNLRETSDQILQISQQMTIAAQESLTEHSKEGVIFGVRAQRNALTVFIITGLLLAYLIFYFPKRILFPFRSINRAIKAIGRGESSTIIPEFRKGEEFWDLVNSIQDTLRQLRQYDEIKTNKIVESRKQLVQILDEVNESIILLSEDMRITHFNTAASIALSLTADMLHKHIENIPALWQHFGALLNEATLKRKVSGSIRIKRTDLKKRNACIVSFANNEGKLHSYVIILK